MNGFQYLSLGYALGLTLLWGYALKLFLESSALRRRERAVTGEAAGEANEGTNE